MTEITNVTQNDFYADLENRNSTEAEASDKDTFLKLMIAQLENQNPLEPQKGGEFLAQLAQFSTVEGIEKMSTQMESMSSSFRSSAALQATSLVGRSVRVPSNSGLNEGEGISGTIELPSSTPNLNLIVSQNGAEVNRINLGQQAAGELAFFWSGEDANGDMVNPGVYDFRTEATVNGENQSVSLNVNANVDSVTLPRTIGEEVMLNVAGAGVIALSEVKQVN